MRSLLVQREATQRPTPYEQEKPQTMIISLSLRKMDLVGSSPQQSWEQLLLFWVRSGKNTKFKCGWQSGRSRLTVNQILKGHVGSNPAPHTKISALLCTGPLGGGGELLTRLRQVRILSAEQSRYRIIPPPLRRTRRSKPTTMGLIPIGGTRHHWGT